MSAIEADGRVQDDLPERVATVTSLPARPVVEAPDPFVLLKQAARTFTPPDLWSDDRPSLRKVWLYGVYGRWTAADGFWRYAGATYATVAALPIGLLYLGAWIVERFPRLVLAASVVGLIKLAF